MMMSYGKIKGIDVSFVITYRNIQGIAGTHYGEEQGIITDSKRVKIITLDRVSILQGKGKRFF